MCVCEHVHVVYMVVQHVSIIHFCTHVNDECNLPLAIVDHSPTALSANEGLLHLGLLQAVDELRNYNTSNLPYQYVRDFIM